MYYKHIKTVKNLKKVVMPLFGYNILNLLVPIVSILILVTCFDNVNWDLEFAEDLGKKHHWEIYLMSHDVILVCNPSLIWSLCPSLSMYEGR
jgi:Na+-transporting methylmalonyl-CoA/oxaloacetate decarboxylase beta subunit